jgi:hypothetical protein
MPIFTTTYPGFSNAKAGPAIRFVSYHFGPATRNAIAARLHETRLRRSLE